MSVRNVRQPPTSPRKDSSAASDVDKGQVANVVKTQLFLGKLPKLDCQPNNVVKTHLIVGSVTLDYVGKLPKR